MASIFTKKGQEILVDEDDFPSLSAHTWYIDASGYVRRNTPASEASYGSCHIRMHRLIAGLSSTDSRQVDHINGCRTDNRRLNLRVCTVAENLRNKPRIATNTSGFKGVSWKADQHGWTAKIAFNKKRITIGVFKTAEEAYAAYCAKAKELHGEFANLGMESA